MHAEADLFIILYDAIITNHDKVGHGEDGFYFGENGEHPWYDISKAIGQALVKRGLSKSDEPTAFSEDELVQYFGDLVRSRYLDYECISLKGQQATGYYYGTNSRARANHSRSLGWKPKLSSADMIASIDAEVDAVLKQKK